MNVWITLPAFTVNGTPGTDRAYSLQAPAHHDHRDDQLLTPGFGATCVATDTGSAVALIAGGFMSLRVVRGVVFCVAVAAVVAGCADNNSMSSSTSGAILAKAINAPAQQYQQDANTENYEHLAENPVHLAAETPVSTFSIDVDTGAYSNVRRFLNAGQLPPQDACASKR
jgi:hypothetical protein